MSSFQFRFSVNGYPHKLLCGDWYGQKSLGLLKLIHHPSRLRINAYITHVAPFSFYLYLLSSYFFPLVICFFCFLLMIIFYIFLSSFIINFYHHSLFCFLLYRIISPLLTLITFLQPKKPQLYIHNHHTLTSTATTPSHPQPPHPHIHSHHTLTSITTAASRTVLARGPHSQLRQPPMSAGF